MKLQRAILATLLGAGVVITGSAADLSAQQGGRGDSERSAQRAEARTEREERVLQRSSERKEEIVQKVEAKRVAKEAKLDEKRLATCEKRAGKINATIARSVEQSERHLSVFQKIAERTQAFYENKGYEAANYDELVESVTEKEIEALAAIEAAGEVTFDCEETDVENVGANVKDLMRAQKTALKEYRTAIKDLIVGVKQAAKSAEEKESEQETDTDNSSESDSETSTETENGTSGDTSEQSNENLESQQ